MVSLNPRVLVLTGFLVASSTGILGCAASPSQCGAVLELQVSPSAASADHLAASPQDQVQFTGFARYTNPPGCNGALPAVGYTEYATWTNPDTKNIQISSARDTTNGTAVCLGATNGAVTLTGSFTPESIPPSTNATVKTVTLTCK